jgi:two-component system phosphate regulon response regulator PhoB
LLRRFSVNNTASQRILIGEYALDRANVCLTRANSAKTYPLGMKEFDILWHLAAHAGTVVQRQDLLSVVWGWDAVVQSRSVDMYVSRLRQSLRLAGVDWTIQAVYATGYRLNLGGESESQPVPPASWAKSQPPALLPAVMLDVAPVSAAENYPL